MFRQNQRKSTNRKLQLLDGTNKGPEENENAFLYFHISLFACSHNTCSPASDCIRCIRTRVFKMQTPDMLKIPESGLIHFLLHWIRYKKH